MSTSTSTLTEFLRLLDLIVDDDEFMGIISRDSSLDSVRTMVLDVIEERDDEAPVTPIDKILAVLVDTSVDNPKRTVDIARESGLGTTRKSVNKYLYMLQSQGKISKVTESNGTKPRWYLS